MPPCAQLAAAPHWRTVDFLSDLHLQASEPATVAAWQRYLAQTPADAVFLLGDVFEVWVGDDALDEPGSFEAQCCAALHAAAQRRTLFFIPGNRDFLVGEAFLRRSGMTVLADPTVLEFSGQRYLLSHGDALCVDDVAYQQFRRMARSPAWQESFLTQPLAARRQQARAIRSQSEARKHSGEVYADVDRAAASAWLRSTQTPAQTQAHIQAQTLIHGHTHRPGQHPLGDGLTRWVLSDWDAAAPTPRADILRLTAAGLQRCTPEGWPPPR